VTISPTEFYGTNSPHRPVPEPTRFPTPVFAFNAGEAHDRPDASTPPADFGSAPWSDVTYTPLAPPDTEPLSIRTSFDRPSLFPILPVELDHDRLDIDDDELTYRTNPFIWQEHPDPSEPKFHEVWPGLGDSWNWKFDELLVFLNEMLVGWVLWHSGRRYVSRDNPFKVRHQMTFGCPGDDQKIVRVSISPTTTGVHVTGSEYWLNSGPWEKSEVVVDGIPNQRYVLRARINRYQSRSIMHGVPVVAADLLSNRQDAISEPAITVIRRLHHQPAGMKVFKKAFIDQLYSGLFPSSDAKCRSDEDKFKSYGGHLTLEIQPLHRGDKLDKYRDPTSGEFYSIVGGCYVHRLAPSLLQSHQRNKFKGLMLDTTWAIMQNYVTAILVAIAFNTAVPLAIAFGPIESFELYEKFYQVFKSKYNIDLAIFKVESDQGSGLKKFCETHRIVHRFCLRHFLASLTDRIFSCYVEYLVKSVTQAEFDMLRVAFCKPLEEAINTGPDPNARLVRARHEFSKSVW
jgi:hypothetical protein